MAISLLLAGKLPSQPGLLTASPGESADTAGLNFSSLLASQLEQLPAQANTPLQATTLSASTGHKKRETSVLLNSRLQAIPGQQKISQQEVHRSLSAPPAAATLEFAETKLTDTLDPTETPPPALSAGPANPLIQSAATRTLERSSPPAPQTHKTSELPVDTRKPALTQTQTDTASNIHDKHFAPAEANPLTSIARAPLDETTSPLISQAPDRLTMPEAAANPEKAPAETGTSARETRHNTTETRPETLVIPPQQPAAATSTDRPTPTTAATAATAATATAVNTAHTATTVTSTPLAAVQNRHEPRQKPSGQLARGPDESIQRTANTEQALQGRREPRIAGLSEKAEQTASQQPKPFEFGKNKAEQPSVALKSEVPTTPLAVNRHQRLSTPLPVPPESMRPVVTNVEQTASTSRIPRSDLAESGKLAAILAGETAAPEGGSPSPAASTLALAERSHPHATTLPKDAPTHISTPLHDPRWSQHLGERIAWMARGEIQSAQININPAQLGPIQISISLQGDQLSAQFVSANQEVRQVLEESLPRLREMLSNSGINLGQTNVGAQQQQRESPSRAPSFVPSTREDAILSEDSSRNSGPVQPLQRGRGLVDLFA